MLHPDLQIDREKLADICRHYDVRELCVFGSAVLGDFGPESDVDVLVQRWIIGVGMRFSISGLNLRTSSDARLI